MGRIRRRNFAAALAAVCAAGLLVGGPQRAEAGDLSGIAGAFADIGIGARAVGMAGSIAAVTGAEAVFWNPAQIDPGDARGDAHVSYCDQMGLVPYSAAAGVTRLRGWDIGLGALHSGDDVLAETTIIIAAAKALPSLPWCDDRRARLGVAARVRRASYGNNESHEGQVTGTALGYGLDVGGSLPIPGDALVAVVVRDALSSLSWDSSASGTYDEGVPPVLAVGVAMTRADLLTVEVGLETGFADDARDIASLGVELSLFDVAALRGGYRTSISDDTLDEFVAGGGVATRLGSATAGVDVAYVFGDLENTLRVALSVSWR